MKIKKFLPIIALSLSSLAVATSTVFSSEEKATEVSAYTNNDAATYYNGISADLTGNSLLSALRSLNASKRQRLISYNSMSNYFSQTDPYPGGGIRAYYSGRRVNKLNREHVWPFSRLNDPEVTERGYYDIEQDMHMIRPAESSDNEERGNKYFGPENDDYYWDPGSLGTESYRGDAARIIFYSSVSIE